MNDADRYYAHFRSVLTDPKHPEYEVHCAEFRALCKDIAGDGVIGSDGVVYGAGDPLVGDMLLRKP